MEKSIRTCHEERPRVHRKKYNGNGATGKEEKKRMKRRFLDIVKEDMGKVGASASLQPPLFLFSGSSIFIILLPMYSWSLFMTCPLIVCSTVWSKTLSPSLPCNSKLLPATHLVQPLCLFSFFSKHSSLLFY